MEKLLEGVGLIIIGLVIIPVGITLLALLLVKLLELLCYVGPIIARITHFIFRMIPAILLLAIIADPEDMFVYLSLLFVFWIPFYVLTRKEN